MKGYVKIGLKQTCTGLIASAAAVATVMFAIKTYAGPTHPFVLPCAAAFTVYCFMSRSLWRGLKAAHDAGEIGRRMTTLNGAHHEERIDDGKHTWFGRVDRPVDSAGNGHTSAHKKTLPAVAPEGIV